MDLRRLQRSFLRLVDQWFPPIEIEPGPDTGESTRHRQLQLSFLRFVEQWLLPVKTHSEGNSTPQLHLSFLYFIDQWLLPIATEPEPGGDSTLETMPYLVMENLIKHLDNKTLSSCRLVSSTIKHYVDHFGISLSFRHNGSLSTVFDICQKANVSVAKLASISGRIDIENLKLKQLKVLLLSSQLDHLWLSSTLQANHIYLRALFLVGSCLMDQAFNDSLSLPVFENLIEVHIYLPHGHMKHAFDNVKQYGAQPLEPNTTYYERVQKNMTFFMRNIRSRRLKILDTYIQILPETNETTITRWYHEPLFEFIENHYGTLEEILLSDEPYGKYDLKSVSYRYPINLRVFGCCSWNEILPAYWQDFFSEQKKLEMVYFSYILAADDELEGLYSLLNTVFLRSAATLTYVRLQIWLAHYQILDMAIFHCLESIKSLTITGNGDIEHDIIGLINLNELQTRYLTTLKLEFVSIGSDFDGIKFIQESKLQTLILYWLSVDTSDPKYSSKLLETALRTRTLDVLRLEIQPNHIPLVMWKSFLKTFKSSKDPIDQISIEFLLRDEINGQRCVELRFDDPQSTMPCEEKPNGVILQPEEQILNLEYMDLVHRGNFKLCILGVPMNFPRYAESYTVYTNYQTQSGSTGDMYQTVQANIQSYSMRVRDIHRIRIGGLIVRPVSQTAVDQVPQDAAIPDVPLMMEPCSNRVSRISKTYLAWIVSILLSVMLMYCIN